MTPQPSLRVTYRGQQAALELSENASTLRQLSEAIEKKFQINPSAQKLLVAGRVVLPLETPDATLNQAGEELYAMDSRNPLVSTQCSASVLPACMESAP